MNPTLSNRIQSIEPSPTLALNAYAKELRAKGLDIVNLSVGEPDFDTPDFIKAAAIRSIEEGFTKYTAPDGIPELKNAIAHKLQRDNQLDYNPETEVVVTSGAKQALYNLAQAVLNQGDEMIIPAPYWVSYPAFANLAEAKPVIVETQITERFKITPAQLEAAITPRTRLLMLNSPSNPTGMAYSLAELKALGEVLKRHPKVLVATDDIYEYILWGSPFATLLNACPELKDRTILINGVSKAYAMTGWRIGYAVGPKAIIAAMKKLQSQSTGNASSMSQIAAAEALNTDPSALRYMVDAFKKRHDQVLGELKKMSYVKCEPSDGAFYLFPNVSAAMEKLGMSSDIELATHLLDKAHVAMVPGTAFGSPGHIRLSCATSEEQLALAMERIGPILGA